MNGHDNRDKALHGKNAVDPLKGLIEQFQRMGYISHYISNYRMGYEGKKNNQFYFQFLIEFPNKDQWVIQSTTSIRDRINIQQWHAYHIKKINPHVRRAIIVYPDSISDKEAKIAVSYGEQIHQEKIFSAIDDVIPLSQLDILIETNALSGSSLGSSSAIQGSNFEKRIVNVLNDTRNLKKWSVKDPLEVGFQYPTFELILRRIGIKDKTKIRNIHATNKIPSLPSGGLPKTDILLSITFENGDRSTYTFSCKRTNKDWVSVHEYPISKFVEVLQISDPELQEALHAFQKVGGVRALNDLNEEYSRYITEKLPRYNRSLAEWVYGGIGGEGDPEEQWARYMITYRNESSELEVWPLEDYLDEILKVEGQLGTPFKWTYPSGGKGKRVQLKGKV